jgi:dTDP-4-amino-4,6-dideoxygalactose transaminase
LRAAFHAALDHVMAHDSLILGHAVKEFEHEFAAYTGTKHAVGVSSGADALEIIMRACAIGPGDEVIVPANSFAATATAVSLTGARPIFCDVESNALMSLRTLQPVVTRHTRMVVPVHLYGRCVEVNEIMAWARSKGIYVVEDACQAHGAFYRGRRAGALADAAAFSFYPTKNLGALGDAGAITTDSDAIAAQAILWRNYGSNQKYHHKLSGKNARLDSLQAAFLRLKLPHLDGAIAWRRQAARRYIDGLQGLPLRVLANEDVEHHALHLFVLDLKDPKDRAHLVAHLANQGVQALIHYPIAIHRQQAYEKCATSELTEVERLCHSVLSLPMFEGITDNEIDHVVRCLRQFWGKS